MTIQDIHLSSLRRTYLCQMVVLLTHLTLHKKKKFRITSVDVFSAVIGILGGVVFNPLSLLVKLTLILQADGILLLE